MSRVPSGPRWRWVGERPPRRQVGRVRVACAAAAVLLVGACGSNTDSGADAKTVKIGALYPLSGPVASQGLDTLHGAELAVEIINGKHPDILLPLAADVGLPKLGGAEVKLISEDTKGDPQTGASAVDRLVTDQKVAAVVGAYQSAVTLTASQNAERLGVPFVNGESSSVGLTQRGLKWFFRTGPSDESFGRTFFDYLKHISEQGHAASRLAVLHTNDTYGNDGAAVTKKLAAERGASVAADVSFDPKATDLTSQVQQIRASRADAVFVLAYTDQALLLTKTFQQLRYYPPAVLAYGAGFADPAFVSGAVKTAEGMSTRSAWSQEIAERNPNAKRVAEMFQKKYNAPMTENSARAFTAVIVLAAAINEAGSTDPDKVRDALKRTAFSAKDTIMPWSGVHFDDSGQNTEASGVVEQLIGGRYRVVFPDVVAGTKPVWPMKPAG
jgi:branched-chain amino acid transport system substrate-binding protein